MKFKTRVTSNQTLREWVPTLQYPEAVTIWGRYYHHDVRRVQITGRLAGLI